MDVHVNTSTCNGMHVNMYNFAINIDRLRIKTSKIDLIDTLKL